MTVPVLSVRNLEVEFHTRRSVLHAINGISFDIAKGEVLGVVGESGAGKSVTGLALASLILAINLLGDWLRDALNPKLR